MKYRAAESTWASLGAAVVLAALVPDLSQGSFSLAILFFLAPIAISLPLALASTPPDASMSMRRALVLTLIGLALHFGISVGLYAWNIKRTTFDSMTYTILELEWVVKLVVSVAVFVIVHLLGKFVLNRRLRMAASSGR